MASLTDDEKNEMSRKVEAWAFTAEEARRATVEVVSGSLERGSQAVEVGKKWVAKLRVLVGDEGDSLGHEEKEEEEDGGTDGEDEEDIWALEAGVDPSAGRQRAIRGTNGPWAGLQGDVVLREMT